MREVGRVDAGHQEYQQGGQQADADEQQAGDQHEPCFDPRKWLRATESRPETFEPRSRTLAHFRLPLHRL